MLKKNIFISILRNNVNYNVIFFNNKINIIYILNINYINLKNIIFFKLIKKYCYENGFKFIFLSN